MRTSSMCARPTNTPPAICRMRRTFPLGKLAERIGELEKFKDKPIIVCCASGMRSNKACGELKKQGFDQAV
jgi:rhodanese-related sulfurtransferase